ncbi:hypothetical protein [Sorangium sp. So ce1151]|uniref:hypothetical protein n=1 Tax=Sorangium sp. So ce1151 TaxID=3133332 RepID=UPI003F62A106
MKRDTEATCKDFAAKLEAAFEAGQRACAALGDDPDLWSPAAAKLIDPELAGQLALAHSLAILMVERAALVARALFSAGAQNGPEWSRELMRGVEARCARLGLECSCGSCARCEAARAVLQRAVEVVRATGR